MATRWQLCVCFLGLFLLVLCALSETFSLDGSLHPVVGVVGQDVVLPCQLSPRARLANMYVLWRKIGTEFIPVHEYSDDGPKDQPAEGYQSRTELFPQEFSNGNVSLKLKQLQEADAGTYHCFVRDPDWSQEATAKLQVAAVAPVFIEVLGPQGQGIGLACRSAGWFPKPEIQWFGKNQKNLATEIMTDVTQDGGNLYSVVSHVTVTAEDTGVISCIMRNDLLKTERQSAIHLSGDIFPRASPWLAAFWALLALVLIAAGVCAYLGYTAKQKISQKKRSEKEALLTLETNKKTLESEYQELRQKMGMQENAIEEDLEKLQKELDTEKKEKEVLQSDCKKLCNKLDAQKKSSEAELQKLRHELETAKTENESLKSELQVLSQKLGEGDAAGAPGEKALMDQAVMTPLRGTLGKASGPKQEDAGCLQDTESQDLHNKQELGEMQTNSQSEPEESQTDSQPDTEKNKEEALQSGFTQAQNYMVPVTLEPGCKHTELTVSEDGRIVQYKPQFVGSPAPSTLLIAVGRKEFVAMRDHGGQSGVCRWYWEVEVGDSLDWALGVMNKTVRDRSKWEGLESFPKDGCWALKRSGGQYHPSEANTVIQSWAEKPTVIGLLLDLEGGDLLFYNVSSMALILEIPVKSSGKLFPFLSPGHSAGQDQGKPLSICSPPTSRVGFSQKLGVS